MIGCLWWGDYAGDDVARSNHRSLRRDFPDEFVGMYDAIGAVGLALPPGCRNDTLATALLGLRNYPLYDQDDNAALIGDLADEAWDGWLRLDVLAMLRSEHGVDTDDIGVDDDALREMFYRVHSDRFGDEYAENAVRVVFPSLAATVAAMARRAARPPARLNPHHTVPSEPPGAAATSWSPPRPGRNPRAACPPGGRWPIPAEPAPDGGALTLAHELGHIACGHFDGGGYTHRGTAEVQAESVAYILTAAGMDTATSSFDYIGTWAHGDQKLIRRTAETVIRTARRLLHHLGLAPDTGTTPVEPGTAAASPVA